MTGMYPTGKGKRAGRAHRKRSSRVFLLGMRGQTTIFPLSFLLSNYYLPLSGGHGGKETGEPY